MRQYIDPEFAVDSTNQLTPEEQTVEAQRTGIPLGVIIISRFFNTMLGKITSYLRMQSTEMLNVLSAANIVPNASNNSQLSEAIIKLIGANSAGLAIGDIIPNAGTVPIPGRQFCDGTVIDNCDIVYPKLYTYVLTNTPFKTMTEYTAQVSAYGQCGFFGVSGTSVRVPLITRPISGVDTINQTGQAILDSIKSHNHTVNIYTRNRTNLTPGSIAAGGGSQGGFYSGTTENTGTSETRGKQIIYPYSIIVSLGNTAGSGGNGAVFSVNSKIGIVVLNKSDVGLPNVDNTADLDKPISTATQTALDLKADINKVFPTISDLGNLSGLEVSIIPESCYKGIADGSFKLLLPTPTDGRTHSFRLFAKAETNANITFNKKIMYDSAITDFGDLISGKYYDYIFTFQPILNKWQMFRKEYTTEPSTLQLLLRFNGNLQDNSPTNLSSGWTPLTGESGIAFDTVNRKFPDDYTASIKKVNQGIASALSEAEKLKAILSTIGTGDFTIGIWIYCPENGVPPAYHSGLFQFVTSNGYTKINDFSLLIGAMGNYGGVGVGSNYDQQHVWWPATDDVWTQGWHYLEVNRKTGVAYVTFDGSLKTSGPYTVDVSAGKDNLAYMQLFGWNASGSTAVSFQEFFILSKASHIADFTPPTAPFVVEED